MYVPFLVSKFQEMILLVIQYNPARGFLGGFPVEAPAEAPAQSDQSNKMTDTPKGVCVCAQRHTLGDKSFCAGASAGGLGAAKLIMTVSTGNAKPRNPPNSETQILRYLTVQIQIEKIWSNLNLY